MCNNIRVLSMICFVFLFSLGFMYAAEKTDQKQCNIVSKIPHKKAEIFLDGAVSTINGSEMNAALMENGKEFYFCERYKDRWSIMVTYFKKGKWTKSVPLWFTAGYTDRDFTMSPDGNMIIFGSNRPLKKGGEAEQSLDLFATRREKNGKWSAPINIGQQIDNRPGKNYPSVASNGNLYFFYCPDDSLGGCDIYMSKYQNGKYSSAINMGPMINSEKNDWDAVIAPDESYIIFSSQNRADTIGGQDLYISFKKKDGQWTKSMNMGKAVNSTGGEICPSLSQDGKILFFTSRRREGRADIYWISSDIISKMKSIAKSKKLFN